MSFPAIGMKKLKTVAKYSDSKYRINKKQALHYRDFHVIILRHKKSTFVFTRELLLLLYIRGFLRLMQVKSRFHCSPYNIYKPSFSLNHFDVFFIKRMIFFLFINNITITAYDIFQFSKTISTLK